MWQSDLRLCILPGLPTYLGQELNVGTVGLYCKQSTVTTNSRDLILQPFYISYSLQKDFKKRTHPGCLKTVCKYMVFKS